MIPRGGHPEVFKVFGPVQHQELPPGDPFYGMKTTDKIVIKKTFGVTAPEAPDHDGKAYCFWEYVKQDKNAEKDQCNEGRPLGPLFLLFSGDFPPGIPQRDDAVKYRFLRSMVFRIRYEIAGALELETVSF